MNISWLKLDVNILDDSKIKIIRKYPGGSDLIILWIGLLCLAMKSDMAGFIYITQGIAYTAQDLSSELDLEVKTVEFGLQLFTKLNMIETMENGVIEVVNFNRHQNIDKIERNRELTRKRVHNYRLRNRNALLTHDTVTSNDTDKSRVDKNRKEYNKIDKEIIARITNKFIDIYFSLVSKKPIYERTDKNYITKYINKVKKSYMSNFEDVAILFLDFMKYRYDNSERKFQVSPVPQKAYYKFSEWQIDFNKWIEDKDKVKLDEISEQQRQEKIRKHKEFLIQQENELIELGYLK